MHTEMIIMYIISTVAIHELHYGTNKTFVHNANSSMSICIYIYYMHVTQ